MFLCDWESVGMSRHVGAPGKLCRMNLTAGPPTSNLRGGRNPTSPWEWWLLNTHMLEEKFISALSALKAAFVIHLNGDILENEKEQNRLFGFADNPVV